VLDKTLALALVLAASCSGGSRDVVPVSQDTVVGEKASDPAAPGRAMGKPPGGSYEYVARRPLAIVALAEARGLASELVRPAIDHLADTLDACVTEHGRDGTAATHVPTGAARVVAEIDTEGRVAAATLRVEPGPGIATIGAMCLVAPTRGLTFPPADAGARGFAVEALWGRLPSPE
jgi:hypothetical protein